MFISTALKNSNLLGTSRKIHKITAVYWVILNLSAQFHSSLSTIQLAVLGKIDNVKKFGYDKFLDLFINHLRTFEQDGIHIKALDNHLKGTVFCVCADNLAAHGLAGFQESFCVEKVFVDFALLANRTYIHCLFV